MFHHWFLAPVQPRAAAMMTTIRRMSTYKDTLNFIILLGVLYYNDIWTITSMKSKSASHRSCPQPSHVQSTWLQSMWLWCKSLFVFVAMRKRALHMRVQSWYTDARINKEMNIDIVFFSFKQKYRVDENAEAFGTGVPSNPSVQLQGRPAVHYFVYKCPFLINCSAILSFSLTKKKGKKSLFCSLCSRHFLQCKK